MPFQFRPIDDGRVLLIRATGPVDVDDWTSLCSVPFLTGEPATLLIDLRRRIGLPSRGTIENAIDVLVQLAPRLSAVALVARPGAQYGCARMVDLVTTMRSLPVGTFDSLRGAMDWLSGEATKEPGSLGRL